MSSISPMKNAFKTKGYVSNKELDEEIRLFPNTLKIKFAFSLFNNGIIKNSDYDINEILKIIMIFKKRV